MIKLNSAIPLYQQVAEDLKNRIEQGEFCSGQSIPISAWLYCICFELAVKDLPLVLCILDC